MRNSRAAGVIGSRMSEIETRIGAMRAKIGAIAWRIAAIAARLDGTGGYEYLLFLVVAGPSTLKSPMRAPQVRVSWMSYRQKGRRGL